VTTDILRSRIAPTPSGYLHIGNALNFILTYLLVRKDSGKLFLRIDDLDAPRVNDEYLEDIFITLEWLGIEWDDGPQLLAEHLSRFSQQRRMNLYNDFIKRLILTNKVFACDCSRKDIQELGSAGLYPGTCRNRHLPLDAPNSALRVFTDKNEIIKFEDEFKGTKSVNLYETQRDFIIRRKDGIPAYHVASLADDIHYNINMVVRGEDLLTSTAAQLYLAELAGEKELGNTRFFHHPLLKNEAGEKLSKSAGSVSIKWWRENGKTPAEFYHKVSGLLGFNEKASSVNEMLQMLKAGQEIYFQNQ